MMDAENNPRRTALTALVSFATGILAGLVFWTLREPAPAPPWQALTGLLGIVLGEHLGIRIKDRRKAAATRGQ
jgi:XapX domain-containing protein